MKERTEASYPASNHLLALRARGLSTPPNPLHHPPPPLSDLSVWCIRRREEEEERDVITGGTLTLTGVMEDGVGPAEVIYGSESEHFLDILFIHLSLFKKKKKKKNPRHLPGG